MHSHVYTCAHLLPPTYWPLCPCLSVPRATATNTVPPAQTVSPLVPPQPCRGLRTTPKDACPSCSLGDPTLTPAGHGVTLRVLSQMKESRSQAWAGERWGAAGQRLEAARLRPGASPDPGGIAEHTAATVSLREDLQDHPSQEGKIKQNLMCWLPLHHQLLREGWAAQAQNFLPSWPPSFCLDPTVGQKVV